MLKIKKLKSKKFWTYLLLYPFAFLLIFEEWGWAPLAAQFDRLNKLAIWKRLEERMTHLPAWGALIILVLPLSFLIPVKLFGLYLFEQGHMLSGFLVIIVSKLFGTAFFARLFELNLPTLMKIKKFAFWYPRWKLWKDNLLVRVKSSHFWISSGLLKVKLKHLLIKHRGGNFY